MYGQTAMEIAAKELEWLIEAAEANMKLLPGPVVNVKGYGAKGDGVTDDTQAFIDAAKYAATIGADIFVPSGTYVVEKPSIQGVKMIGNGDSTRIEGIIRNSGYISGIIYNGYATDRVVNGELPVTPVQNKMIVNYDTDSFYIISKNPAKQGYVSIRMRSAQGQGLPPFGLVRQREVHDLWESFAYIDCRNATTSGEWSDYNFQASSIGAPAGTGHGDPPKYIVGKQTNVQGAYLEQTVTPDTNGYINIVVLGTTSTPEEVNIYINGNLATTFNSRTPSNRLVTHKVFAGYRDVTVRVEKGSQFGILYLAGFQVHRPDEGDPIIPYTDWAIYRLPTHYIYHHGANEYAFFDLDLGRFVGSGHGEEERLEEYKWYIDGVETSFTMGVPRIGRAFTIEQKTLIANKLTSESVHIFRNDASVEKIITLAGEMRTDRTYFGMCSAFETFTEVEYPTKIDDVSGTLQDHFLGLTDTVIQRNPTTNQRIYTKMTCFTGWNNARGGVFIKSDTNERFKKMYSGANIESENIFRGATKQIIHVFA